MAIIAFIPARGGSKSIPHKNIKSFCGKPLIYWNLIALQDVKLVDQIVVATDSEEIAEVVTRFDLNKVVVFARSPVNANDTASTESVMLEYLNEAKLKASDLLILVQVTSPFTQTVHFNEALHEYCNNKYDSMLTCVRQKRFFWTDSGKSLNYDYTKRPRRQDFDGYLMENGAFYINNVGDILKYKNRISGNIGVYEMPAYTGVEIDDPEDWIIAEQIMLHFVFQESNQEEPNYSQIKLFLTDVDGVLTDAGMYYSENGDELKKFNTRDGMAFQLLREVGIKTGIITSENTKLVERRAQKLNVDYLFQGKRAGGKLEAALEICKQEKCDLKEIAYIGDDENCIELLQQVGLAACPADSMIRVKSISNILHLQSKGGEGVVREFVDLILNANRNE